MGQRSEYKRQKNRGGSTGKGRTVTVKESDTLLSFLFQLLEQQSKSSVKALLKHGQISVNGRVTTQFDTPLKGGDQVKISYERGRVEFNHPLLRIVWEDDLFLVVDKREGLLSTGNSTVKERTAFSLLSDYLKKNDPRARLFLLNPLDKETSGLMLFARNRGVQQLFLDGWNQNVSYRSFITVVEGRPEKQSGILSSGMPNSEGDTKVIVSSTGDSRQAVIRYNVLKSNSSYSLVEIVQESGKKNIIREQMAFMGHPVIGTREEDADNNPLGRVAIHANRMCIRYPETGEELCFESHYPPAFNVIVKNNATK